MKILAFDLTGVLTCLTKVVFLTRESPATRVFLPRREIDWEQVILLVSSGFTVIPRRS